MAFLVQMLAVFSFFSPCFVSSEIKASVCVCVHEQIGVMIIDFDPSSCFRRLLFFLLTIEG